MLATQVATPVIRVEQHEFEVSCPECRIGHQSYAPHGGRIFCKQCRTTFVIRPKRVFEGAHAARHQLSAANSTVRRFVMRSTLIVSQIWPGKRRKNGRGGRIILELGNE